MILRLEKGIPLTTKEMDNNINSLNTRVPLDNIQNIDGVKTFSNLNILDPDLSDNSNHLISTQFVNDKIVNNLSPVMSLNTNQTINSNYNFSNLSTPDPIELNNPETKLNIDSLVQNIQKCYVSEEVPINPHSNPLYNYWIKLSTTTPRTIEQVYKYNTTTSKWDLGAVLTSCGYEYFPKTTWTSVFTEPFSSTLSALWNKHGSPLPATMSIGGTEGYVFVSNGDSIYHSGATLNFPLNTTNSYKIDVRAKQPLNGTNYYSYIVLGLSNISNTKQEGFPYTFMAIDGGDQNANSSLINQAIYVDNSIYVGQNDGNWHIYTIEMYPNTSGSGFVKLTYIDGILKASSCISIASGSNMYFVISGRGTLGMTDYVNIYSAN